MAVSKAQQASVNKYVKSNYDRINVTMPKGEKDAIQKCAAAHGESVNGFIVRSIRERMERDVGGVSPVEMTGQQNAGMAPVERVLAEMPTGGPQEAAGAPAGGGGVSVTS